MRSASGSRPGHDKLFFPSDSTDYSYMRRAVMLFLFLSGCSTAPIADLLDFIKPGRITPEKTAPYGGVCGPRPLAGPPVAPAPIPPPPVFPPAPTTGAPIPAPPPGGVLPPVNPGAAAPAPSGPF
jgi:hypothetical protein